MFTLTLLKFYNNHWLLGGGTMKNVATDDPVEMGKETTGLSLLPQKYHKPLLHLWTYVQSNLFVEYKSENFQSVNTKAIV